MRLTWDYFSDAIGMATSMVVVLPEQVTPDTPVIHLLHGHSDDQTIWDRRTRAEIYSQEYGVAMVMPLGGRSFYIDEAYGLPWYTMVTEEIPAILARTLRLDTTPERTFVAGASMGGYGALRWGLTKPASVAAVGAFAPAVRLDSLNRDDNPSMWTRVLGESGIQPEHNPYALVEQALADGTPLPELFISTGDDDFLRDETDAFSAFLTSKGIEHGLNLEPGVHDWRSFDRSLEVFMTWLEGKGLIHRP